MINFNDMPNDIKLLIFGFNREAAVIEKEIKNNKQCFNMVLNDIKYVNYYYNEWTSGMDDATTCSYEFTRRDSKVLNYIDMIDSLRSGADQYITYGSKFDLWKDQWIEWYDSIYNEEHTDFMHELNDDYQYTGIYEI